MKTNMRKIITLLLVVVMTIFLAGCGGSGSDTGADTSASGVDVDLTELSSTMVYSEVSNMVTVPDDYVGKTVKMQGQFAKFFDESVGEYYFACIIADATACCQQGLEFQLAGNKKYPDDYPEDGSEITVQGTFGLYDLDGQTYITLKDAKLL